MASLPLQHKAKINDTRIDVDLCFVCDCTNTMDAMIKQVLNDITNLVSKVSSKLKAQLRVAFVAYRDYPSKHSPNPESRIECYNFTSDLTQFIDFLQQIKTDGGGGDRCEDVLGGLQSSLHLEWKSPTKVLFHICDDPPHGTQYHTFYDEIKENRSQLMEFMNYDTETCKDIFGEDSWEFAWIFQYDDMDKRLESLEQYITSRKDERDRFPNKHKDDPAHDDILFAMKNKNIQYYIAKKTKNVDKMIGVFKSSGLNIGYNVETSELTACTQLFGAVYHSITSAITISKEVQHTQLIQQRARRLFLDSKQHNNQIGHHIFKVYCGIDFGTDGTAFAYCLPGDDNVYTPEWEDGRIVDTKLKTNILLDASKNHAFVAFGQRARELYMNTDESDDDDDDDIDEMNEKKNKKRDFLFFEKFKMALYELAKDTVHDIKIDDDEKKQTGKQDIYEQLVAINGERCESKTVIIEALKFVKQNALDAMNGKKKKETEVKEDDGDDNDKKGLNVTVDECQWVLTVPAIWSNRSKGIMVHCAEKAGLLNSKIPNHLIIAFEPDCASIAIQHEYITQKKQILERRKQIALANKKRREANEIGKGDSVYGPILFRNNNNNNDEDSDSDNDDWILSSPRTNNKKKKGKQQEVETPGCSMRQLREDDEKMEYKEKTSAFNTSKKFFVRGEKYILADLGGGTADIACHEILSEYNVREIYRPSGGPYGSTYIDREFIKLLSQIISKRWMKAFKLNEPHKYVELVSNFQFSKVNFWRTRNVDGTVDKGKKITRHNNIRIPFEFTAFIEEKIEGIVDEDDEDNEVQSLEELFNNFENGKIDKGWLKLQGEYLVVDDNVWEYLFDSVVIPICEHIERLMDKLVVKQHRFKYLLLAGGFCESNYVKNKLFNRFGMKSKHKLRIVIPRRPILQVVTGAALWCKHQCGVRSRMVRNTIGVEVRQSLSDFEDTFNRYLVEKEEKSEMVQIYDGDDDLLKKFKENEFIADRIVLDKHLNEHFVDGIFYGFVSFGDEIAIDDPPIIEYIKPIDKESDCIEIKLFEFESDELLVNYSLGDILDKLNNLLNENDLLNENKQKIVSYFRDNKIDGELLIHKQKNELINDIITAIKCKNKDEALNELYSELIKDDNIDILFTDHNQCKLLATKQIKLPKQWIQANDGKKDIPIAFFFGDTQIKVYIGIKGINKNEAEINLNYQYYDV